MKARILRAWIVIFLVAPWPGLVRRPLAAAAPLQAGAAVTDITPPAGWRLSGYFYERPSTRIHDPLQAKAVVFQQGREKAALVFCDMIGVPLAASSQARQLASRRTGIPAENILLAATHSHTGPLYYGALREYFHQAAIARNGKDPNEGVDYPAILIERLADTIVRADRGAQPVRLEIGKIQVPGLSFNRRFVLKDGTVVCNPGKLNTNIVRAAGPVDPELIMVLVMDAKGERAQAALSSFPLHPDIVGGTEYSADYPLYFERSLRRYLGPNLVSIFGNGTCGDINHVNVADARAQKGQEEAERIGATLANAAAQAFPNFNRLAKPALAMRSTRVTVPLQEYPPEEVAQARERMKLIGSKQLPFLSQAEATKIVDLQLRNASSLALEVQGIRLGADTALVGLPGEIFVELGLAIKRASPFENTVVFELCNDSIGYVPTRKAFAEGSYETVNSRVKPGGGEMLVETAIQLLRELKGLH